MIFHRHLPVGVAKPHLQAFLCCVWCLKLSNLTSYHRWLAVAEDRNQILIFFVLLYFLFKGKCYFSLSPRRRLLSNLFKTLPFQVLHLRGNTNETKKQYGRIHQAWAEHCFSSMGMNVLPSPVPRPPRQHPKKLTINTSLWTANRNRIHTMHIFRNSCPFENSSLMSRTPLVTVRVIFGDVLCPLAFPPQPGPNITAQEGTCNMWLCELALVRTWSTVGRDGRSAAEELNPQNNDRWEISPRPSRSRHCFSLLSLIY